MMFTALLSIAVLIAMVVFFVRISQYSYLIVIEDTKKSNKRKS